MINAEPGIDDASSQHIALTVRSITGDVVVQFSLQDVAHVLCHDTSAAFRVPVDESRRLPSCSEVGSSLQSETTAPLQRFAPLARIMRAVENATGKPLVQHCYCRASFEPEAVLLRSPAVHVPVVLGHPSAGLRGINDLTVFFDVRASTALEVVRRECERAAEWGSYTVGGSIADWNSRRVRLDRKNFASQLPFGQFPYVESTRSIWGTDVDSPEATRRQQDISSDIETDIIPWNDDELSDPEQPNADENFLWSVDERRQRTGYNPRARAIRASADDSEEARIQRLCQLTRQDTKDRCPYVSGYERDEGPWKSSGNMYDPAFFSGWYPDYEQNETLVLAIIELFAKSSVTTATDPLLIPQAQLFGKSKSRAILACAINGLALRYTMQSLRDDSELVGVAVRSDWRALRYASRRLRSTDRELARLAISQCGWALKYCSGPLRDDLELACQAVGHKPWAIQYTSRNLWGCRDLLEVVAGKDGFPAMLYARVRIPELIADKHFVMLCASTNGLAVKYAAEELLEDREIAEVALRQNPYSLRYFLGRSLLLEEKGIELLSVALRRVKELRTAVEPKDLFDTVARRHPGRCPTSQDGNDPFVFPCHNEIVDFRGLLEHHCGKGCKLHKSQAEQAFDAYRDGWLNLVFDSGKREYAWADIEVEGTPDRPSLLETTGEAARDTFEFVRLAVEQDPGSLEFASARLRADPDIVMTAVVQDAFAFRHASEALRSDSYFVVAALEKVVAVHKDLERYYFGDYSFRLLYELDISWRRLLSEEEDEELRLPSNVRADIVGGNPELCRRVARIMPWLYLYEYDASKVIGNWPVTGCYTTKLLAEPYFCQLVLKAACTELFERVQSPAELVRCRIGRLVTESAIPGPFAREPDFALLILTGDTLQTDIRNAGICDHYMRKRAAFPGDDEAVADLFRRANRDTILFVLGCCGSLLGRAGRQLQGDIEAVVASVSSCPSTIAYASPELQTNLAVLRAAGRAVLEQHDAKPRKTPERLHNNIASPHRRNEIVEKFFVRYMQEQCGWAKEAVLDFLPDYRYLFFLLPTEELREDDDILRLVMELDEDNFIFERLPEDHKMHQNKQVVTQAVKRDPSAMLSLKRPSPFWIDEDVLAAFREKCPNPMERFMHFPAVVELTRI